VRVGSDWREQRGRTEQSLSGCTDQSGLDTNAASAGRRVYVGNLSWSVQSQDLTTHMAAAGTVLHARVLGSSGRSKGCGVVEFATEDDAQRAIEMLHDTELDGRKIFVREDREAKPVVAAVPAARHESRGPSTDAVTTKRVYVGNLSWTVKWQSLKDHMKVAGTVIHADGTHSSERKTAPLGLLKRVWLL
jgi:RNA recognition motif-containing protein